MATYLIAGGTVGVIIPPSVIFLIYGVTMDVPSVDLFIGGMIPGLLMVAVLVGSAVVLTGKTEPGSGIKAFKAKEVVKTARNAWAGFIAIGVIFFGIYYGYFSPTEAAGVVAIYVHHWLPEPFYLMILILYSISPLALFRKYFRQF